MLGHRSVRFAPLKKMRIVHDKYAQIVQLCLGSIIDLKKNEHNSSVIRY